MWGMGLPLERQIDIEVVREAQDGGNAIAAVQRLRHDVVLMDIDLPGMSGIEATRRITETVSVTAVLMLTYKESDEAMIEAL